MRSYSSEPNVSGITSKHLPYDLFAKTIVGHAVTTQDGTKHVAVGNSGRCRPNVDRDLHPCRHRCRADAPMLADEIDNAPASIALLQVRQCQ